MIRTLKLEKIETRLYKWEEMGRKSLLHESGSAVSNQEEMIKELKICESDIRVESTNEMHGASTSFKTKTPVANLDKALIESRLDKFAAQFGLLDSTARNSMKEIGTQLSDLMRKIKEEKLDKVERRIMNQKTCNCDTRLSNLEERKDEIKDCFRDVM